MANSDKIAKSDTELATRIMTTSPDVRHDQPRPWINRRKPFARAGKDRPVQGREYPVTGKMGFARDGQHIELGIAEMNLFMVLAAAGMAHRRLAGVFFRLNGL